MNHLQNETSPYLISHQNNPVDWYPWCDEAFEKAEKENKPVLLSVGYAACHWCHVMAHESFEDEKTAKIMNEFYVCVKVDREERPDIDEVYMEALHLMSRGRGGWPMTVFLSPKKIPLYAGTYFPKHDGFMTPSFTRVLLTFISKYKSNQAQMEIQGHMVVHAIDAMSELDPKEGNSLPSAADLDKIVSTLEQHHDEEWGGFSKSGPKFPPTMDLEVLLRCYSRTKSESVLAVITNTLDAMASGGIYDHLGGGFCRYSVDARWEIPHFEKMLYDQAMLTRVYLHAWQVTQNPSYRQVVEEIIAYVIRDLRWTDNDQHYSAFYSSEDADSEGHEGKFYVWNLNDVREHVDPAVLEEFVQWFGVTEDGNFENKTNNLHRPVRGQLIRPPAVEQGRRELYAAREKRVRPGLDNKVIVEWNALMMGALAEAGAAMNRHDWIDIAVEVGEFLLSPHVKLESGRYLRCCTPTVDSPSTIKGFAMDYSALLNGFLYLHQATGKAKWVIEAQHMADATLALFWDSHKGGVFTVGTDAEQLVMRSKELVDKVTPSPNSDTAFGFLRLASFGVKKHELYHKRAIDTLNLISGVTEGSATSFGHFLCAVDNSFAETEIVITASNDMVHEVLKMYLPHATVLWGEVFHSAIWEGKNIEEPLIYVCHQQTCLPPVKTVEELIAILER